MEEHLSKTWSELLKTTQRLDGLEGVLLDKEYMEHRNNEEISNLRQSEKKLELENKRLQDDITGLRDDIKGLRDDMVVLRQVYMKNKDEVDTLRRLVQTKESNYHEKPLPSKPSKNYTGRKMDDSKSPAHRYVHDIFSHISILSRSKKQTLPCHHLLLRFRANNYLLLYIRLTMKNLIGPEQSINSQ